jgi:3-dehydroquinate synthase
MSVDKKVIDGQLRLVLLRAIGEAVITHDYTQDQLVETIQNSYSQ